MNGKQAILIVSHGSPNQTANGAFLSMVGRLGKRLGGLEIFPAFMSLAEPTIQQQLSALADQGAEKVIVMPYFLFDGQHVSEDIPCMLDDFRRGRPEMLIEFLPSLQNSPALEDIVTERLASYVPLTYGEELAGGEIESRSMSYIDERLAGALAEDTYLSIVRRVIHATADFSFAQSLRVHPQAIERGTHAIQSGMPIVVDVRMVQAGITRAAGDVLCAIDDADVVETAKNGKKTRAAAAMEKLAGRMDGAIVAIGNAPTALWKVLELACGAGLVKPALVVGLPVGFVGARESKLALLHSELVYITNVGNRGGSSTAAAVINALADQARME